MARSWKDVKADKARRDAAHGRDMGTARAEARTRTQAYILGFRLAQLREEIGMSQAQLAESMAISQPRVSQIERGDVGQLLITLAWTHKIKCHHSQRPSHQTWKSTP